MIPVLQYSTVLIPILYDQMASTLSSLPSVSASVVAGWLDPYDDGCARATAPKQTHSKGADASVAPDNQSCANEDVTLQDPADFSTVLRASSPFNFPSPSKRPSLNALQQLPSFPPLSVGRLIGCHEYSTLKGPLRLACEPRSPWDPKADWIVASSASGRANSQTKQGYMGLMRTTVLVGRLFI
jgi:hypothetical protein